MFFGYKKLAADAVAQAAREELARRRVSTSGDTMSFSPAKQASDAKVKLDIGVFNNISNSKADESPKQATRHDTGKLKTHLMPPEWQLLLSQVLHQGSKKYDDNNWLLGMPASKCLSAAERHLLKWKMGEAVDDETQLSHLGHAAWNLLALYSYELRGIGKSDLDALKIPVELRSQLLTVPELLSKDTQGDTNK